MYKQIFILITFLFLTGCEKVDKKELQALNSLQEEENTTKIALETVIKVEKNTTKESNETVLKIEENLSKEIHSLKVNPDVLPIVESNETLVNPEPILEANTTLPAIIKTDITAEQKYLLALEKIQKDIKLAQDSSNHQLAIATLYSEKEREIKIKELEKELEVSKSAAINKLEIAKLELQKTQEIEKTKQTLQSKMQEKELEKIKNEQTLAQNLEKNRLLLKLQELEVYKIVIAMIGFLILIGLLIFYILRQSTQDKKAKLIEDEQKQLMNFKIMEEQGKNLDKMLKLITEKELSNNVEKEILNSIKESQKKTLIFEERPKKGLIFRR